MPPLAGAERRVVAGLDEREEALLDAGGDRGDLVEEERPLVRELRRISDAVVSFMSSRRTRGSSTTSRRSIPQSSATSRTLWTPSRPPLPLPLAAGPILEEKLRALGYVD